MRIWYDTEFWEQGNREPIIPISYGLVREDGQELYLIDQDAPLAEIANRHPWLRENVLPHLPVHVVQRASGYHIVEWDEDHPDFDAVRSPSEIRMIMRRWLTSTPDLELWAWYGAYDHVVLAQTFGTMSEMPQGVPYWTNDVRQLVHRDARVPVQKSTMHNALADAHWCREVHQWWDGLLAGGACPACGRLHGTWCPPYGGQSVRGSEVGGGVVQLRDIQGDVHL